MVSRRQLLRFGAGSALALPLLPALSWAEKQSRDRLVDQLVAETGLARDKVQHAISQAKFHDSVIRRITTPYEARPYSDYRPLFVHPALARLGDAYMDEHRQILSDALARYHLQPQMIAAILGMETKFGRHRGKDRVLDSLFTLATGYARRADFFRRELGEFLLMCQEEKRDPAVVLGSYAGAFGTTQFIPSSYRAYAVDGDGDGRRDVWDSPRDIIFSVANYFHRYHWDDARPVAHWLPRKLLQQPRIAALIGERKIQWQPLGRLRSVLGALPAMWHDDDQVSVIALEPKGGSQPLLIHHNFYVITRWNRSHNYAMAATELAALMGDKLSTVGSA
ncbi:MAG: lytic murein transglycosylase [Mariprofundales bacterium]